VNPHDRFDIQDPNPTSDGQSWQRVRQQFLNAQQARQTLADQIYRRLLSVTGVALPADRAAPSDAELAPRRWLAQLAVNILDFIDEDDLSTPFNFYTSQDADLPGFDAGVASDGDPELPRYWVFGTELPRLVINEVLAEYQEPAPPRPDDHYFNKFWVELHNPFEAVAQGASLQPQDGLPVPLRVAPVPAGLTSGSTSGVTQAFGPYQVVIANRLLPRPGNDNVLGRPDRVRTQLDDFPAQVTTIGSPPRPAPSAVAPQGFFLLGPPDRDARGAIAAPPQGTVPAHTPILRSPALQYRVTYTTPPARDPDDRSDGVTVLLRRLANPHIPFDPQPTVRRVDSSGAATFAANPWYNPYLTVDYLEGIPLRQVTDPPREYASRGKRQPYTSHPSQVADQVPVDQTAAGTRHTFGWQNNPMPDNAEPPGVPPHYDWLVHLDRQLISPMELLHVSAYQPYQLTQRFVTGPGRAFNHRVPWFDQTTCLYRVFEFLETHPRAAGVSAGGRIPGKVNINTVWDGDTLLALCDPQPSNHFASGVTVYNPANPYDPATLFGQVTKSRTPDLVHGGTLSDRDRPFRSLATGFTPVDDAQFPGGGIEDTLLRTHPDDRSRRLFEVDHHHPYLRTELLTKV
jgi:hypothetical protein